MSEQLEQWKLDVYAYDIEKSYSLWQYHCVTPVANHWEDCFEKCNPEKFGVCMSEKDYRRKVKLSLDNINL